jgi:hypothetical protein
LRRQEAALRWALEVDESVGEQLVFDGSDLVDEELHRASAAVVSL